MDFNELLAMDFDSAQKLLLESGYHIDKIDFLNEPPGSKKVVRVQSSTSKSVNIIVSYHHDPIEKD